MDERRKVLTEQVVVRVDPKLHHALKSDAEANGRTVAQTVRFHLNQILASAPNQGMLPDTPR